MNAPTFNLEATPQPNRARVRRGGWSWGPVEGAKLRVLSLGAGIQSTTLALMAAHGALEPLPDAVIFADTGAEPPAVYEHLRWLRSGNVLPFDVTVVHGGNIIGDLKRQVHGERAGPGGKSPSAPFFAPGRKGAAPIRRQCTGHYKIDPINRVVRGLLGFKPRQRIAPASVEMWIGISVDEVVRAGPAVEGWIVNRYPLLEQRMSRRDCEAWLLAHDYPVPPKSACTFCPYRTNLEWRRLKDEDPQAFAQACEIDELIRGGFIRNERGTSTGNLYVHRSMKRLAEIDFRTAEERGQGNMLMVCEAGCGL
ncbi:hypothetical protein [Methylobacterium sp. E-045]|uniref:hypothetical protein n=1 Tax=Methylobacterium sp. E-045 TaxID=2836575 RepID=UPI001FBBFC13|nr:hypothetical protein [Methylobacterium sp. E-045]MCJ2129202.1 hypothetical protein [Methylobacterium sp. E-045]